MAGNFDNIRLTCSWYPGQVALIMLLSIDEDFRQYHHFPSLRQSI